MTSEQYKAMTEAMEKEGWTPLRDIFNNIHTWEFSANGKRLSSRLVEAYWRLHGSVPAPF